MSIDSDPSLWAKVSDWAWAVILLLGGAMHQQNVTRMKEMRDAIGGKADKEDLLAQAAMIQKVFDRMREIELASVATKTQMERIVSHLESETRTRAEANREIMAELRAMRTRRVRDETQL